MVRHRRDNMICTTGTASPMVSVKAGDVRRRTYWLDIGRHDDYELAFDEFERMRNRLLPP